MMIKTYKFVWRLIKLVGLFKPISASDIQSIWHELEIEAVVGPTLLNKERNSRLINRKSTELFMPGLPASSKFLVSTTNLPPHSISLDEFRNLSKHVNPLNPRDLGDTNIIGYVVRRIDENDPIRMIWMERNGKWEQFPMGINYSQKEIIYLPEERK
jgi:hypothetical protein